MAFAISDLLAVLGRIPFREVPDDLFKKFSARRIGWLNPTTGHYRPLFMIAAQKDGSILISSVGNIPSDRWFGYTAKINRFGLNRLSSSIEEVFEDDVHPKINFHKSGAAGISRTQSSQRSIFVKILPLFKFWRSQIFSISNYRADLIKPEKPKKGDIVYVYESSGPTLINTQIFLIDAFRLLGNRTYLHEPETGGAFISDGEREVLSFALSMNNLKKVICFNFRTDPGSVHKNVEKPIIHLFAFHRGLNLRNVIIGLRSDNSIPNIISVAKRKQIPFRKFFVRQSKNRNIANNLRDFKEL